MPVHFTLKLTDEYGKTLEAIEGAAQRLENMDPVFGDKGGDLCRAWADSRREMYQTKGRSTGAPWPGYTMAERRYYLPVKRAALGRGKLPDNTLLRFSPSSSWSPMRGERLYPGLTDMRHREFVYRRPNDMTVEMGTLVPWAKDVNDGTGEWVSGTFRGKSIFGRTKRGKRHVVRAPARRLVRFGEPFIEAFRKLFQAAVVKVGGRAGMTTAEVFDRINPKAGRG